MELKILERTLDLQCYSDLSACKSPRHPSMWINYSLITLRVGKTINCTFGYTTIDRRIVGMPFLLVVLK